MWEDRFWEKVVVRNRDECWEWVGNKDKDGYGRLGILYKMKKAHRLSWEIHHGHIPPGKLVCHSCDNPSCVNPFHLFIGTAKDNSQDMTRKKRSARGYQNARATLTSSQVSLIRRNYKKGEVSYNQIAKEYGVSKTAIGLIVTGKTWRNLPVEEVTSAETRSKLQSINSSTKLTPRKVNDIRKRYAKGGISFAQLAKKYGVSRSTIGGIISGRKWRKF